MLCPRSWQLLFPKILSPILEFSGNEGKCGFILSMQSEFMVTLQKEYDNLVCSYPSLGLLANGTLENIDLYRQLGELLGQNRTKI